jgi:hypothetical protein
VPTPEEIALEKDAAQLRAAHHFREALDKYKAIADLQGKEAPAATKEIGVIEQFLANENSVMEEAKTAEAGNDLGGAKQNYERVIDLHGEREAEAKNSLDFVKAKIAGASETQIADSAFVKGMNDYNRLDYAAAEPEFEQALNRAPQNWTRRLQVADYLRKTQSRLQQENHVRRALDYFSAQNYDAAKNEANQAISAPYGDPTYKRQAQNLIATIPKPVAPPGINPSSGGSSGATDPGPPKVDASVQQVQQLTRDAQNLIQQGLFRAAADKATAIDQLRGDSSGLRQQISSNEANVLRALETRYQGTNKQDRGALVSVQADFQKFESNAANAAAEARQQSVLIASDIDKLDHPKQPPKDASGPAKGPDNGGRVRPIEAEDKQAIEDVLKRYESAFAKGDMAGMRSVRQLTGNEAKTIEDSLKAVRGQGYALRCSSPQVNGDEAQIGCDAVLTASHETKPRHTTFFLKRIGGHWMIVTR